MFGKGFELALLMCVKLAEKGKVSSATELSEWLGVSLNFTHQILHKLKKHGILKTIRGSKGGVELAKPAGEILVLDIIKCIEPAAFEISCGRRKIFSFCDQADHYCFLRSFMEEVYHSIKTKLQTPISQLYSNAAIKGSGHQKSDKLRNIKLLS